MKKETITIDFSWISDFYLRIMLTFNSRYWFMNESYSPEWDKKLRDLMKEHNFRDLGGNGCTAILGNQEIWVANHPYASFTNGLNKQSGRPSRITIYRAYEKLIRDRGKNRVEGIEPMTYIELFNSRNNVQVYNPNDFNVVGNGSLATGVIEPDCMMAMPTYIKDIGNGIPNDWGYEI